MTAAATALRPVHAGIKMRYTLPARTAHPGEHVHAVKTIAGGRCAVQKQRPALGVFACAVASMCRQSLRPRSLGLLGVALSIAIWSYANRMPRYEHSQESSQKVPTGKALPELCFADVTLAKVRVRNHIQADTSASGREARRPNVERLLTSVIPYVHETPRGLPFFDSALPLRSPPAIAFA